MLTSIMGTSLESFKVGFRGDKKCKVVPMHSMNAYGGWEIHLLHLFLTSALDGGEWSASYLGHFTSSTRAPHTH